jgi:cytochrome c peroxidase
MLRAVALAGKLVLVLLVVAGGCGGRADDLFCAEQGCGWAGGEWDLLVGLTRLPPPPPDPSNRYADDPAVATLGQRFYFDIGFSGPTRWADALRRPTTVGRAPLGQPSRISCATCHDLGRGGVDVSSVPGNVSVGAGVTDVNALPTVNAASQKLMFWNGRLASLWGLNLVVAESDTTVNGNRLQTAHLLADRYGDDMEAVFGAKVTEELGQAGVGWRQRVKAMPIEGKPGRMMGCQQGDASEPNADAYDCLSEPDRLLADRLLVLWAKAIAAFERRLVSKDSAFDLFMAAGPKSGEISEAGKRGARLFVGKASCIDCHHGPLLTDGEFHNIGVPQGGPAVPTVADCAAGAACDCVAGRNCLPWGAYNGQTWQREAGARWLAMIAAHSDDTAATTAAETQPPAYDERLKGAWKTPSLRDVALTAPYMHDGVYSTLEQVVAHYNSGGRGVSPTAVGQPTAKLKPLGLSQQEASDLVEFLKTLTGAPLPAALLVPNP